jgi:hypothetical protein
MTNHHQGLQDNWSVNQLEPSVQEFKHQPSVTSSIAQEQEQILQKMRMLELEESLILDLMEEMKTRDELLTRLKKDKTKESVENNESVKSVSKKKKKAKEQQEDQFLSSFMHLDPFSLVGPGMSLPYCGTHIGGNSSSALPSSSSAAPKAAVVPASLSNSKNLNRQVMVNNIAYNVDVDGCAYEDQPNHTPLLQTPAYQHFSSSLSGAYTASIPKIVLDRLSATSSSAENELINETNFLCFNCGEKGHMFGVYLHIC